MNENKIKTTLISDESGSSNRVVFLHGLFGRGKNFTHIARALLPERESLLVDLPNHGESAWTADFSYENMADAVAELLAADFATDGPINLVGHSMGGKVAMLIALRHPDLVKKLVILDISPSSTGSSQSEFDHLLSSLASLDLEKVSKRSDAHELLRAKIANDTVRGFLLQNLKLEDGKYTWEPNLTLLYESLPAIMGFPEVQQSAFIAPVLWVGGSRSNYITDSNEPRMRELFPLVERHTIEGAGHWLHSEKPAEVVALLRDFLAG